MSVVVDTISRIMSSASGRFKAFSEVQTNEIYFSPISAL